MTFPISVPILRDAAHSAKMQPMAQFKTNAQPIDRLLLAFLNIQFTDAFCYLLEKEFCSDYSEDDETGSPNDDEPVEPVSLRLTTDESG